MRRAVVWLVLVATLLLLLPASANAGKGKKTSLSGTIRRNQSFTTALLKRGVDRETAYRLAEALSRLIDFHRVRPGSSFRLTRNPDGSLQRFVFRAGPLAVHEVEVMGGEWVASRRQIPLERKVGPVSGVIRSSLFESMDDLGEGPELVFAFVEIFAWDVDFHESQPGDRFRLLVEKFYHGDSFVKYGRILVAQYQTGSEAHTAVHFRAGKGPGQYYDLGGRSLKKTFLKSPLRFSRISSGYTRSRLHPILGGVRPHLAIDYAAPEGTPVWAVADGVVAAIGRKGANGNSITVRHGGGYQTQYNHLSRFARKIRRGVSVKQGQVIGYVGATGLATGPHLDYRVIRWRRTVNPLTHQFPRGRPVPPSMRPAFLDRRDALMARLEMEAPH